MKDEEATSQEKTGDWRQVVGRALRETHHAPRALAGVKPVSDKKDEKKASQGSSGTPMLFGEFLVNENLPEDYRFTGPITKKNLTEKLVSLAKERPDEFPEIVKNVKQVGDMFATYQGVTVGLDDITPDYATRNSILDPALKAVKRAQKAGDREAVINTLLDAQQKSLGAVMAADGALHRQVRSGSRGKSGQLMKAVFSPVVAKGKGDIPEPWLVRNSYAEGLSPSEFWVTAGESRRELNQTQLATAIPGDTSKQVTATLNNVMITKVDCGTSNGLEYSLEDPQIIDRYEAGTNKLITPQLVRSYTGSKRKTINVRSPMTCRESPGVCQKCYGHGADGQLLGVGTSIGLRSAHALSEPLTQMVLSSKHGGQLARGEDTQLHGVMGFRQLLDVPRTFKNQAVLSRVEGRVSRVEKSPQGGHTITIEGVEHYAPPQREVMVRKGDKVVAGHQLTDGVPNPQEVVELQGLGSGRKYVSDTIYDIYRGSGVDIDKRHVELLVKQDLNYVKVKEPDSRGKFIRGDVVPYNLAKEHLERGTREERVNPDIIGERLGQEFLHYTVGTPIDRDVYNKLKNHRVRKISVTKKRAEFEPIMRPLEQVPLMSQDWVSRLAHRRLKDTLLEGAAQAWESPVTGPAPYPAIIYGQGTGPMTSEDQDA